MAVGVLQRQRSGHLLGPATYLAIGSPHTITVVFGGDANYTTSTSAALSPDVNQAPTTTTVGVLGKSVGDRASR